MNLPPPRNPAAPADMSADDLSIPILTERLGLPPLEFDTTLPLIETTGQMFDPSLEGLTALPTPPQPVGNPPGEPAAGVHPIAALPFPPPAPEPPPVAAPPATVALATLPKTSAGATYGGFIPPAVAPRAPPPPARAVDAAPATPAPPAMARPASMAPPAAAPAPAAAPVPFTLEPAPPGTLEPPVERRSGAGQHWGRIEVELRSSILRQITEQLPREIDAIVQGRMQDAIDRLLSSLAEEIHLAVTASLADIVERAVRAELDRMRNSNRG